MRIEHINNEFGDISTAVIYNFNKFLPTYKNREHTSPFTNNPSDTTWIKNNRAKFNAVKVLYHGGLKKFDDIDFAEYDFRYVLENHKFNSRSLLSYLDSESRKLVGKNRGNLNQINSTIFPTTSNEDSESKAYEYFNTLLISSVTSYLFSLDPGNARIELFEDTIEGGNCKFPGRDWEYVRFDYIQTLATNYLATSTYGENDIVLYSGQYYISQVALNRGNTPGTNDSWERVTKPDTVILLGPDEYSELNRDDYYVSNNVIRSVTGNKITRLPADVHEQTRLEDEIYSGKVVWLAISPTNNIRELNLSYAAWLNSEDANRYKNKFNLRNDEYYGNRLEVTRNVEDTDIYRDIRSGKILGTNVIDNCPILKKKLEKVKESYIPDNFEYERLYHQDCVAKYAGSYWRAVEDVERTFPGTSRSWQETAKPILQEYDSSRWYPKFSEVTYDHKTWRSTEEVSHDQVPGESKKWKEVLPEYSPEVEYAVNSRVSYEGKIFTAIMKNNRGHFPNMSPHWILTEKLTDYYTKRLTILPSPISGGYSIPSKQVTLMNPDDASLKCGFQIVENLGYNFDGVQWEGNDGSRTNLVEGTDYEVRDYTTASEVVKYVELQRRGLDKILGDDSRKRVIFNFEAINAKLKLSECYVNSAENRFKLETSSMQSGQYVLINRLQVIRDGVVITDATSESSITTALNTGFEVNDEVRYTLCLVDLDNSEHTPYRFEECNLVSTLRGISSTKSMDVSSPTTTTITISGVSYFAPTVTVSTIVDYTTSSFDVKLANSRKAIVDSYAEFELSEAIVNVPYAMSTSIYFYGTYRDCLDHVVVNGTSIMPGESKTISNLGMVLLEARGKSSVGTTLYCLAMSEVKVDASIQIIAKTD